MFVRWSLTRPGVPTKTCGLFANAMACAMMSTPPTSVAVRTPMQAPSASNCGGSHNQAPPQSVARAAHAHTASAAHLAGDLHGQLTRWRQNQGKERLWLVQERLRATVKAVHGDSVCSHAVATHLQDGQGKGARLPGSCLCKAHNISAWERQARQQ